MAESVRGGGAGKPATDTSPARLPPWRRADDQPAYATTALLLICVLAAVLYARGITQSQYRDYYADAARSMSGSWKAFFFGSFDPGNSITIDKLPGFLWPQALAARLFGFHPWVLTLPQVLEGIACVLVLHRAVRRWTGVNAALIAAAVFLATPATAGLFRTQVEDPLLTLCLLLAADATQRAALSGRLRSLVLAGVWVGVGFQAKMLEAWAVLPALGLVYLVSAPAPVRRRLAHLGIAAAVAVVASASWVLAVSATPADDRPYVDGTTNNSAVSMAVGYNFLSRFSSVGLSAAGSGSVVSGPDGSEAPSEQADASGSGRLGAPLPGDFGSDESGWGKLLGSSLASQTGWLYPFAAVALGCGLWWRRGKPRTDGLRAGLLLWGTWLATYFLAFSAGSVGGHIYYLGVIAVPLAALTGAGTVLMWREHRTGGRRAWALPLAIATTAAWSVHLSMQYPSPLSWLGPATLVLGIAGCLLLALALAGTRTTTKTRIAVAGLTAGLCAVVVTPGAWATQVFNPWNTYPLLGSVGPTSDFGQPGGFVPTDDALTPSQQRLLAYTTAHRGTARYLFASTNETNASPFILDAGAEVLPLGGFTGRVPYPTLPGFQQLVDSGQLQYVLVNSERGMGGFGGAESGSATTTTSEITVWVLAHCATVSAGDYGADLYFYGDLYRCGPGR
ncbi:ArnT family glycosyltransferase [Streptacidiphilus jiangxiensis]|uniref:Dolichyl-phosphate-mannose-protein mannosyltransferase n=1 Tax=Streptacidiphilus jiangxiensis TaxID=235985 RepID=A0A1H7I8B1_STRJI|nr:glycosyltransferase family 39 protein [Streptacidiphilus jiangxiensis]SEK58604.1 Dolichyl-phosphate-mannose-protein mannosyltransferase [Streptacidiphilus jiangxiensis]